MTRLRALLLMLLLATLIGWLPGPWWLELAVHFVPQYTLALLMLVPLWWRDQPSRVLAFLALGLNLCVLLPLYHRPGAPGPASGRIVSCNLLYRNAAPGLALQYLHSADADVLALQEVTDMWISRLNPLFAEYQGKLIGPRLGPEQHGVLLLTREPLQRASVASDRRMIWADTTLAGRPLHVVVAHPPPPVNKEWASTRDAMIRALAAHLRDCPRPYVVLGDFNDTPWARSFAPLAQSGRARRGIQGSWPADLPPPLRIPIDHCLLSDELRVVDCRLGPRIGSDHLPLETEVQATSIPRFCNRPSTGS